MRRPPFKACSCKYARRIPGGRLCIQSCGETHHRNTFHRHHPSRIIAEPFASRKHADPTMLRHREEGAILQSALAHLFFVFCVCSADLVSACGGVGVEKNRRHNAERLILCCMSRFSMVPLQGSDSHCNRKMAGVPETSHNISAPLSSDGPIINRACRGIRLVMLLKNP